jgi:ferredoxin
MSVRRLSTYARWYSIEVKTWLKSKGIQETVADGIMNAFKSSGVSPSVSSISSMGDVALKSLVESVERDINIKVHSSRDKEKIEIIVDIPHAKHQERILVAENDSLHGASSNHSVLTEHIEWTCGGVAACATCHVYVDPDFYNMLDPPDEDELDMLDMAWGVNETSRLACQMTLNKKCKGMKITIPEQFNDMYK